MRAAQLLLIAGSIFFSLLAGCTDVVPPKLSEKEAKIKANLDKLSPEDREAATAQKYCVIETDNRLGAMGVPRKIMIKGQPVFLCCKGCEKEAKADPDKTLAKVKELKKQGDKVTR